MDRQKMFTRAMTAIAGGGSLKPSARKPLLYGPTGKPLMPTSEFAIRRTAAQRTGSMKNWIPRRLFSQQAENMEREAIVERSIDLINNEPHAAGIVDTFASTVIGAGLRPHPQLDHELLGIDKIEARKLQRTQRALFDQWWPHADAGGRMSFGQIQYLTKLSMIRYGEYFVLLPMIDDPLRPYALGCLIIHPLRVKTPVDLINDPRIKDGVELGEYGQPVAYWVKKSNPSGKYLAETSANFLRIPAKKGHRWNMLHGFVSKEPEQVRGMPLLAPAMKAFRDFGDLIDAELVSNVVTAALSYWVEAGDDDAYNLAEGFTTDEEEFTTATGTTGTTEKIRYEETWPGRIFYGNPGEKMHMFSADRPGTTFEPFTRGIKKALSFSCNMPYAVLFKDVEGVNFAGFRSAMLDAWRVYSMERTWHGQGFCQPIYTMIQEEAYLRNQFTAKDFYSKLFFITRAEWRGAPKGDIEPVKAVQAQILKNKHNLKTKQAIMLDDGDGDYFSTMDDLEEEAELERTKGLTPPSGTTTRENQPAAAEDPDDTDEEEEETRNAT